MSGLKFIFCLTACVALSSCVFVITPDYPKYWPVVTYPAEGHCPNITGRYQNIGVCEPKVGGPVSGGCSPITLASAFFDLPPENLEVNGVDVDRNREGSSVDVISGVKNTIEVRINHKNKNPESKTFIRNLKNDTYWQGGFAWSQHVKGFDCSTNGLSLKSTLFATGILITTITINIKRAFSKMPDGDLMMREDSNVGGYVVGIPIIGKRVEWMRWKVMGPSQ